MLCWIADVSVPAFVHFWKTVCIFWILAYSSRKDAYAEFEGKNVVQSVASLIFAFIAIAETLS